MRTIDATLVSALASGIGTPILNGFIGTSAGSVLHNQNVISYKLTGSTLEFEMAYTGDISGGQTTMWLTRGLSIAGVNYTLTTGRFWIQSQRYITGGRQIAKGQLFKPAYYAAAGDDTYENVITAFCAAYGKTAVFREPAEAWLDYKFLPTGKSIITNNANALHNLLQQKYLIFMCDRGNEEVLVYSLALRSLMDAADFTFTPKADWFKETTKQRSRYLIWRDEFEAVHTSGTATDIHHNLGFLPSIASPPTLTTAPSLCQVITRPDFRILDGDLFSMSIYGGAQKGYATVLEQYEASERQASVAHFGSKGSRSSYPRWETVITSNEVYANTAGGAMPSTIERVANYTPLNTSNFNGILSANENNVQAAMDKLDNHTH